MQLFGYEAVPHAFQDLLCVTSLILEHMKNKYKLPLGRHRVHFPHQVTAEEALHIRELGERLSDLSEISRPISSRKMRSGAFHHAKELFSLFLSRNLFFSGIIFETTTETFQERNTTYLLVQFSTSCRALTYWLCIGSWQKLASVKPVCGLHFWQLQRAVLTWVSLSNIGSYMGSNLMI